MSGMSSAPGSAVVRQFISEAGFPTLKAFADAVGMPDYEVSRILSEKSPRRPTGLQLKKIAIGLGKKTEEVAGLLLPTGGLEQELLEEVVSERDQLLRALSEARGDLVAERGRVAAAEEQVKSLGKTICGLYRDLERLKDELAQEQARAAALEARRDELLATRTRLEEGNRSLQLLVAQQTSLRASAADELAKLYSELERIRDARGRDEIKSVQKQILAGTLGAAVGAIITRAASSK